MYTYTQYVNYQSSYSDYNPASNHMTIMGLCIDYDHRFQFDNNHLYSFDYEH